MADDWDLHAVVRGCTATTTTNTHTAVTYAAAAATSCSQDDQFLFYPDPFEVRISPNFEDLSDLFKPFFPKLQPLSPQNPPISPMSVLAGLTDLSPPPEKPQKQSPKHFVDGGRTIATPRSKRRKNQMKRLCQVPAEALSSDVWSWRKYGQKPIKGSPYPRGYYRCSTLKGCSARKQVERNRSDPGMFIVTYTGDHNHPMPTHRNSLAGSTRQKPVTPESVTAGDLNKPSCSSAPVSPAASLSPATEKMEGREDLLGDEDDEFGVSDLAISDDFFEGLEELSGPAAGDCFPGHSLGILPFPWLATTTAAGGG